MVDDLISGPDQRASVFVDGPPPWQRQESNLARARADYGDQFPTERALVEWFRFIMVPASGAWAFKPSGKTGTTTTLHALFELEFGVPLTVSHREPDGILEEHAAHRLAEARVFSHLTGVRGARCVLKRLDATLRLTTVRHPFSRAVSGFRYLCSADAAGVSRFLRDRLRMNAVVGFDWEKHPDTVEGFLRFLDYLDHELAQQKTQPVDWHFGPQVLNVRPEIFRPHLVGKTEDLPGFFAQIAERLDRPLPEALRRPAKRNQTRAANQGVAQKMAQSSAARDRVSQLFAADFDAFGYQPDELQRSTNDT